MLNHLYSQSKNFLFGEKKIKKWNIDFNLLWPTLRWHQIKQKCKNFEVQSCIKIHIFFFLCAIFEWVWNVKFKRGRREIAQKFYECKKWIHEKRDDTTFAFFGPWFLEFFSFPFYFYCLLTCLHLRYKIDEKCNFGTL